MHHVAGRFFVFAEHQRLDLFTVETVEFVSVKLLKNECTGTIPSKIFIELTRNDKGWSSGKVEINEIGENYAKLHSRTNTDGEAVYITVIQTPIAGVSAKSISANPKIESFQHENYDYCYTQNQTYFRVYDDKSAIDICAYNTDGENSNAISDYSKIQEYLDAI